MGDRTARTLATGLGLGSIAFGLGPLMAPRFSARLFGLPLADAPSAAVVVRSVGVRDAVIGLGLWSAASHGGNYAPWVLARALCDLGDSLAIAIAVAAGERNPRLLVLGAIAVGAAGGGLALRLAVPSREGS
jgi:hypothetical protein